MGRSKYPERPPKPGYKPFEVPPLPKGRLTNAYEKEQQRPKRKLVFKTFYMTRMNKDVRDNFKEYCKEKKVPLYKAVQYVLCRVVKENVRLPIDKVYRGGTAVQCCWGLTDGVMSLFRAYCASRDYPIYKAGEVALWKCVMKRWPIEDARSFGAIRNYVPDEWTPPL